MALICDFFCFLAQGFFLDAKQDDIRSASDIISKYLKYFEYLVLLLIRNIKLTKSTNI